VYELGFSNTQGKGPIETKKCQESVRPRTGAHLLTTLMHLNA